MPSAEPPEVGRGTHGHPDNANDVRRSGELLCSGLYLQTQMVIEFNLQICAYLLLSKLTTRNLNTILS